MSRSRIAGGALAARFDAERLPLHCHSILRELGMAVRADQAALILQSTDPQVPSQRLGIRIVGNRHWRLVLEPADQPRIDTVADDAGWIEESHNGSQRNSHLRATLWRDADVLFIVDATRRAGAAPFTEPDILALQRIAPGLELAIKAMMNCAPSSLATDVFRRLPFGVALLSAERRVLFQNAAMQQILHRRDGLLEQDDTLRVRTATAQRALVRAMREIAEDTVTRSGLMVWPREKGRPAYLATAERFHAGFFMVGRGEPAIRLTVVDPDYSNDNAIAHVAEHFGLTPSEIDVVQAMVLGLDVAECAARLKLAVNTVRWHQKRIFAKTGTSGRPALILLFIRGSQLHGA